MMNPIINDESINNHDTYAHPQYKTAQRRLRKDDPLTTEDIAAMQGVSLSPHAEIKEKIMCISMLYAILHRQAQED